MATANVVEIIVKATDKTKTGFDKARLEAEKAGKDAGGHFSMGFSKGFMNHPLVKGTLFGMAGAITTAASAGLAALPAMFAAGGALAGIAFGAKLLIGTKKAQGPLYKSWMDFTGNLTKQLRSDAEPLIKPLKEAFKSLGSFFKEEGPVIKSLFSALAPLIKPLVQGLEGLVGGALYGFVQLMKAAKPAVDALSTVLAHLGGALGDMFTAMAPAVKASSVIFKALGILVADLFPIIGKLAAAFARDLAPVLETLFKAFMSLMPAITVFAKILGSLAGAVIGSVAGVLKALAGLIVSIAPGIKVLANAFKLMFTYLENGGVLFILENAFIKLVPLIAKLVLALVQGLAPVLPIILKAMIQLASVLAQLVAAGLAELLKALIPVVSWVLKAITAVVTWLQKYHLLMPVLLAVVAALDPIPVAIMLVVAAIGILAAHWSRIWGDIKVWTKDAVDWVKTHLGLLVDFWKIEWDIVKAVAKVVWAEIKLVFKTAWDVIAGLFKVFMDILTGHWSKALNDIETLGHQIWNNIKDFLHSVWGAISSAAHDIWNTLKDFFSRAWHDIEATTKSIWNGIVSWFKGLPGRLVHALWGLGHSLSAFISAALHEMWNGAKSVGTGIVSWFKGIGHAILNGLKGLFGIHSPSSQMHDIGHNLMLGLENGIKSRYGHVAAAMGNVKYHVGAGVSQWSGLVRRALGMEGLPQGLDSRVLAQMQSESGGNPNAINNWDINAQRGDPSRGLMQVIMSTFRAYHWPGTSWDIYNPLANIAAAVNYARHVYGPGLEANGMGIGSMHGYWAGGPASGLVTVGEHGRELLRLPVGSHVFTHADSAGILAGGGRDVIELEVTGGDSEFERFMVRFIKRFVRVKGGGSVQAAFGRS